jgi:hypothetical protein
MKYEIRNRFDNTVMISGDYGSLRECVLDAVSKKANLSGADLSGSNLSWAYLSGADLFGAKNVDAYFQFGPVGPRNSILVYNATKKIFQTGCFSGTEAELVAKVKEKHAKTEHLKSYLLAIKSLKALACESEEARMSEHLEASIRELEASLEAQVKESDRWRMKNIELEAELEARKKAWESLKSWLK